MQNSVDIPGTGPQAAVRKLRILIVEDHTPTRMAMSRLIRQAGADVTTARDGDGNTTSWQSQYQHVGPAFVVLKMAGKDLAGLSTVAEIHSGLPATLSKF